MTDFPRHRYERAGIPAHLIALAEVTWLDMPLATRSAEAVRISGITDRDLYAQSVTTHGSVAETLEWVGRIPERARAAYAAEAAGQQRPELLDPLAEVTQLFPLPALPPSPYVRASEVGQPEGVAQLDPAGRVPLDQLPENLGAGAAPVPFQALGDLLVGAGLGEQVLVPAGEDGEVPVYDSTATGGVRPGQFAGFVDPADYADLQQLVDVLRGRIDALETAEEPVPEEPGEPAPTAPGAPATTTAVLAGTVTSIRVEWSAVTGASLYRVGRREAAVSPDWTELTTVSAETTTYEDSGLPEAANFDYRVAAENVDGQVGPYGPVASAQTGTLTPGEDTTPPGTQVAPTFTLIAETSVRVHPAASAESGSGLAGSRIDRSADAGQTWSYVTFLSSSADGHTDTGLSLGRTYLYRTRPKDNAGNLGEYSPSGSVTTLGAAPPPPTYRLEFSDDFTNGISATSWGKYNGAKQLDAQGPRSLRNVYPYLEGGVSMARMHAGPVDQQTTLNNGMVLEAGDWAASGMSCREGRGQYGAFELVARATFPAGNTQSIGTRLACLLWPFAGWPPEVDFFESGAEFPDKQAMKISNWFVEPNGKKSHFGPQINMDFTVFRTFWLEWQENLLRLSIDGNEVWETDAHVPAEPLWLGGQTAIPGWTREGTGKTPLFLDFASVKIYRMNV